MMPRVIGGAGSGLRRNHATTRGGVGRGGLFGHVVQEQRFDRAEDRGAAGRAAFDFGMHDVGGICAAEPDHSGGGKRCASARGGVAPLWSVAVYSAFLTVMSFVTDLVPRTSWASLVTRDFSAAELASPVTRTTPSLVVTLVFSALVVLWLRSAYFT